MKHSKKFIINLIIVFICSITFASGYLIEDKSYFSVGECGSDFYNSSNFEQLVNLDFSRCMMFSRQKNDYCIDNIKLNSSVNEFGFFFVLDEEITPNRICLLSVSEINSKTISKLKINNNEINHIKEITNPLNQSCNEKINYYYFNSNILLNGTNPLKDVVGRNKLDIIIDGNTDSYLKYINIGCSNETNNIFSAQDEVSFDQERVVVNTTAKLSSTINSFLQNYEFYNLYDDLKYIITLKDVNTIILPNSNLIIPKDCTINRMPVDTQIICSVSSFPKNIDIKLIPTVVGSYNVSTRLRFKYLGVNREVLITQGVELIVDLEEFQGEASLENNKLVFYDLESQGKTTYDLKFGDKFEYATVDCSSDNVNRATLIVRNKNSKTYCTYSSNYHVGFGKFNIDLNENYGLYDYGCNYPFIIDKSGLYEFEFNCNYAGCEGPCFNPLPRNLPTTSSDWRRYFLPGRSFFSFYNNNSILDCVCNSNSLFANINIIDEKISIEYEELESTTDDIYFQVENIHMGEFTTQLNIGKLNVTEDFDVELLIGCFDVNGCINLSLDILGNITENIKYLDNMYAGEILKRNVTIQKGNLSHKNDVLIEGYIYFQLLKNENNYNMPKTRRIYFK